jgi:hypothetical protein
MAIESETTRLLLALKQGGVNFGKCVMLGRQNCQEYTIRKPHVFQPVDKSHPGSIIANFPENP